jgi:photosystem II stability/assembly factor-like uncharacterized protein
MHTFRFLIASAIGLALVGAGCHDTHLDYDHAGGEIALFDDLYSISVVDRESAVAVGYYGTVYYTHDGGTTWNRGQTDTLSSLYKVSMADKQHGWAVGQRGLIMRTEDGGATWKRQKNLKEDEGSHLFGIAAIDKDTAWVIGEWGTRITTTDGGANWVDASFLVDERHPMFVWLSPSEQEKVRNGETVYEDVGLNDVYCMRAPGQRCWLIGEFGYIFYSEDRGQTWISSTIEGSAEIDPVRIEYNEIEFGENDTKRLEAFAAELVDEAHLNVAIEGVATKREIDEFGRSGDPFQLFETLEARAMEVRTVLEDAGLPSERVRMRGQPPWDYEDYLADDPEFLNRYFDSRLFETGGVKVRVIQNPILFTVRFRDENNGLIAGLGGVILRTNDGGKSWSYRKIDLKQALFSVGSVEGRALAVGEKGLVRVSTDEGDTWNRAPDGTFPTIYTYLRDIEFEPTGQVGFIVGQTGQILKSSDAGFKWEQVLPPEDEDETKS